MAKSTRVAAQPQAVKQDTKTAEAESKQVQTIPAGGALAAPVPDYMAQYQGQGAENIGQEDVETPRIKLLQGLSPEVEQFDLARVGHFWHTVAQMDLGPSLRVVPVYIDMQAILWNPRESGGGILARSNDLVHWIPEQGEFQVKINKGTKTAMWRLHPLVATSKLLEWGSSDPSDSNSQPAATKIYNVVVSLVDYPDLPPAVVSLQRSSVRVAKRFLGQLKLVRAPTFGCRFQMSSTDDRNSNGQTFKNFQFSALGLVDNEQEFLRYKELYEMFKRQGLRVKDLEGLAEEGVSDVPSSTDADAPAY